MQHNATLSIVDVTIKSPLCTDIIEAACEKPGATAEKAERDKISKYKPFTDTKPATAFVPCWHGSLREIGSGSQQVPA